MRGFLILAFAFLWSCEWQPEKIPVAERTNYRSVNLALNDTTRLVFPGSNLQISGSADGSIVEIESFADSVIVLVGVGLGETSLVLNFTSDESVVTVAHVRILVSNGILLSLYYNEWQTINLRDYLSADELVEIDSIQAVITATGTIPEIDFLGDLNSATFDLISLHNGEATLELVCLDSAGVLIASLVYKTNTMVRRTMLAEIFTNAGCVNCPLANENLDLIYEEFPEDFTAIRYHVFWTDPNDPMNLYNPSEVETRRIFYGNSYEAPRLFMNGILENAFDELQTLTNLVEQSKLNGSKTYISYPDMNITLDSLYLDIQIKNFDQVFDTAICWTVLTEDSIYYEGTNGETIHNQAMRDMTYSDLIHSNLDTSLTHSLQLPPDFSVDDTYHLVTFIQDKETKEIIQAIDRALPEIDS